MQAPNHNFEIITIKTRELKLHLQIHKYREQIATGQNMDQDEMHRRNKSCIKAIYTEKQQIVKSLQHFSIHACKHRLNKYLCKIQNFPSMNDAK